MNIRALIAVLALAITSLQAQQEGAAKPAKPEGAKQTSSPSAYRFEYTLAELSGKQKITARKFEILTSERGSVQSSSKVAMPVGSFGTGVGTNTQFNYVDLGLNANMHYTSAGDGAIRLDVDVSMTVLVPPETTSSTASPWPQATRTVKMQISTEVKPGVPTSIGTVEDVASTHAFELSVTATPR